MGNMTFNCPSIMGTIDMGIIECLSGVISHNIPKSKGQYGTIWDPPCLPSSEHTSNATGAPPLGYTSYRLIRAVPKTVEDLDGFGGFYPNPPSKSPKSLDPLSNCSICQCMSVLKPVVWGPPPVDV